jgi:phosphoglycerate dehydrogenase-like enzyme
MIRPVGVSRDFLDAEGTNIWGDITLSRLSDANVQWEYLEESTSVLTPDQVESRPAVLFAGPAVDHTTFAGVSRSPMVLARFGVGYDAVDLAVCTKNDVAVTITPDGARRPVAAAALTMILAAQHNLAIKDRLVRAGRWEEREVWMGRGLTGSTIGLVGLGSTATDLVDLLKPFNVRVLSYDPYCSPERAAKAGVTIVDLNELASQSDVVVVMATLTPETHHLIGVPFLSKMKRHAVLVNVSRGSIVDEKPLISALLRQDIAGAALDVFEHEPLPAGHPLLTLENVTLSPHSIAWTNEMSTGNGTSATTAILEALAGRVPRFVVNQDVVERHTFRAKLAHAASGWPSQP